MANLFKLLRFFLYLVSTSSAFQCKDHNNNPVDWFVAYKLPKHAKNPNQHIEAGLGFMYMTSDSYDQWQLSEVSVNDSSSMIGATLSGLYTKDKKQDVLYVMYNDQPPQSDTSSSKGHTKGVVVANQSGGFWLIHSVPHFPYSYNEYVYPKTGTHYGQSLLCISLNLEQLNNVGVQLQYNEPRIFEQAVPDWFKDQVPELAKAANNQTVTSAPWFRITNLTSKAGTTFTSFAKSGKFGKDLYADLVGVTLQSDLYVETWPNEPNRLPSDCDHKFQVDNVLDIQITQPVNISFKTTADHSKWAVSTRGTTLKWICIGDINRAEKQTKRGGGTTCLNNDKLAEQYLRLVTETQQCPNYFFYLIATLI